mmetsp:Transcript_72511/g.174996  ORF Transcript_72511/g.174996 Transcript_72511/m.174996 type:complete len:213 (+) Transcript_72511:222-860(+)
MGMDGPNARHRKTSLIFQHGHPHRVRPKDALPVVKLVPGPNKLGTGVELRADVDVFVEDNGVPSDARRLADQLGRIVCSMVQDRVEDHNIVRAVRYVRQSSSIEDSDGMTPRRTHYPFVPLGQYHVVRRDVDAVLVREKSRRLAATRTHVQKRVAFTPHIGKHLRQGDLQRIQNMGLLVDTPHTIIRVLAACPKGVRGRNDQHRALGEAATI